jgi:hypothetical protein
MALLLAARRHPLLVEPPPEYPHTLLTSEKFIIF